MALSKASNTYNRTTWEDAEFPILCQICLGDNPYVRMMKEKYGRECKICQRPFTVFRWCPGRGMRYKKTEICQTCCKLKNVCQTCLLDLEYGLPVQVRDTALQIKDDIPKVSVNRDFYVQNADRQLSATDGTEAGGSLGQIAGQKSELLQKLARTAPYYRRNLPHICSFWVKGECKRGEECPYRHEKPTDPDDPLNDQNIRDRYYGTNDPVADKLLSRAKAMPSLRTPDDSNITTLYVGNLGEEGLISETDLRDFFYQFGEIRSISLVGAKGCAFVQFTSRSAAELAAEKSFNKLTLHGRKLTVRWGRPQSAAASIVAAAADQPDEFDPVPGLPRTLPPPPDFFGLTPLLGRRPAPGGGGLSLPPPPPPFPFSFPPAGFGGPKRARFDDQAGGSGLASGAGRVPQDASEEEPSSSSGRRQPRQIYYPSQDPMRLGARDLID